MPTPEQLHSEITSGPLASELAPFVASGSDAKVADVLNRADRPGYVPARWVSVSLGRFPALDALIHWAMTLGTLPDEFGGGVCPFAAYALFRNLDRVDKSVDKGDLRASVTDLSTGLTAAATGPTSAMIPSGFGTYLLSGERKISRAEEAWGYGASVSSDDVALAYGRS